MRSAKALFLALPLSLVLMNAASAAFQFTLVPASQNVAIGGTGAVEVFAVDDRHASTFSSAAH